MEEAFVILASAAISISIIVIPFYVFVHFLTKTWDGSDKTKQYRKD